MTITNHQSYSRNFEGEAAASSNSSFMMSHRSPGGFPSQILQPTTTGNSHSVPPLSAPNQQQSAPPPPPPSQSTTLPRIRQRVSRACSNCQRSHMSCEESEQPKNKFCFSLVQFTYFRFFFSFKSTTLSKMC